MKCFLNSLSPDNLNTILSGLILSGSNAKLNFGVAMIIILPPFLKSEFLTKIKDSPKIQHFFFYFFVHLCTLDLNPYHVLNINVMDALKYFHETMESFVFNDSNFSYLYNIIFNLRFVSPSHQSTSLNISNFDHVKLESFALLAMRADNETTLFKSIFTPDYIITVIRDHNRRFRDCLIDIVECSKYTGILINILVEQCPHLVAVCIHTYKYIFFETECILPCILRASKRNTFDEFLSDETLGRIDGWKQLQLAVVYYENPKKYIDELIPFLDVGKVLKKIIILYGHFIKSDEVFVYLCTEILNRAGSMRFTGTICVGLASILRILKFESLHPILKMVSIKMEGASTLDVVKTPAHFQQFQQLFSEYGRIISFDLENILHYFKYQSEFDALTSLVGIEMIITSIFDSRHYDLRMVFRSYRSIIIFIFKKWNLPNMLNIISTLHCQKRQ